MSLFGKLLAVLNLLGALGFIYLASMDYGVRQQWAYVVLRYDLMLNGLPVDPGETDKQGQPAVEPLGDDTIKELFNGVGGEPRRTQVEEVEAARGKLNAKLQPLEADKRQHAFALAGVLLPMADSLLERDEYLATQAHLASDATLKALEARYAEALREAKRPGASGPDRPFEQAFRLGVRSQGGAPSEGITTLIVDKLPKDPAAAVDVKKLLDEALEGQRQGMVKRLERLFTEALTTAEQSQNVPPDGVKNSRESQRAAIARLLFGLSVSQASDALENADHPERAAVPRGAVPGTSAWTRALAGTAELARRQKRVYVVCGIKTALNAITARSATLRLLASQVDAAAGDERILFLSDDAALLEEAREQAARLKAESDQIAENVKKLAAQRDSVAKQAKSVEGEMEKLDYAVAQTKKDIGVLRAETEKGRVARVNARNLLKQLAEREKTIQELERQVRAAEGR